MAPRRTPLGAREWSEIPHDALVSILRCLIPPPPPPPPPPAAAASTLAYFAAAAASLRPFALVCRAWRAAAGAAASELASALPPLLWECPPYYRSVDGDSVFYSPLERRPYRKPMPAALSNLASCVGFSQGYVIATVAAPLGAEASGAAVALSIVSPFTGDAVRGLPPLPQQCLPSHAAINAVLSAPPVSTGCVLVAFEHGRVLHCRISDPAWAVETAPGGISKVRSAAAFGRKIYALTIDGILLTVDPSSSSSLNMTLSEPWGDPASGYAVSLADSGAGDLLAVQAIGSDSFFWIGGKFAVFRMDFASGKWVRLRRLGSRALFVDCYGHVVSSEPGRWGGRGNCVYFTSLQHKAVGVYSMEDGSVEYLRSDMSCYRATDMWVLPGMCSRG